MPSNLPWELDRENVKKVVEEHNPDGVDYDVKPLLLLVENIFSHAALISEGVSEVSVDHVDDNPYHPSSLNIPENLSNKIDQICRKISYNVIHTENSTSTTNAIFDMLTNYEWDVKLVLTLAAFAMGYGEIWLLAHIHSTNQIDKPPELRLLSRWRTTVPKGWMDELCALIKVILEGTKCVIEFNDLPQAYITPELSDYTTASTIHIPVISYRIISSVVELADRTADFLRMAKFYGLTTTTYSVASGVIQLPGYIILQEYIRGLKEHLVSCQKYIEKKKEDEDYEKLCKLFKKIHNNNIQVLKALIYANDDDMLSLFDSSTKKRVGLDVLESKNVLLLISKVDYSHEKLSILQQIYNQATEPENKCELVWIPIVDAQSTELTEQQLTQFESLRVTMPGYSVYHPSLISRTVIRFIQSEWEYKNKPVVVVLDPHGRVACPNATHMMWIWGSSAFPFTSSREEALWREETWRLELLLDGIDSQLLNWISDGKYIFLYGGDDFERVRDFVKEARKVAEAAQIPLEMVYVGRRNKREQVQRVLDGISQEKLSIRSIQDQTMIWLFWTRLVSMLFSKIKLKQDNDLVMQEINKLLSYDRMGGFIILARGSHIVVNGYANTGLQTLIEYEKMWREHAEKEGFETACGKHYRKLHEAANPCCRLEFSDAMGRIPEDIRCPECQRHMNMLTTFQCCHDEGVDDDI